MQIILRQWLFLLELRWKRIALPKPYFNIQKSTSIVCFPRKAGGEKVSFSILVLNVDLVPQKLFGRRIREPNFGEFLFFNVFFFGVDLVQFKLNQCVVFAFQIFINQEIS